MFHVLLYKRHKQECERKDEPAYKRCSCPVCFQTNVDGKQRRWSSKEAPWEVASGNARRIEHDTNKRQTGIRPL
jgi:hypothetical protein